MPETLSRVRQRLDAVFEDAIFHGHCSTNPAAAIRRKMRETMPAKKSAQFAALPYREIPEFMASLRDAPGIAARSLDFALHTASRTSEVLLSSAATTYTATTLTDTTVGTLAAAGKLIRGMIIDTKHVTPLTGRIQSWAGNVITVDAWYTRTTGVAATPANGTGAVINPNTKIWGQNTNIFVGGLASNNQAKKGTGYELGLSCDPTIGTGVWGFDAVTLLGTPERHFSSRGSATYGYYAETGKAYAYKSNSNGRGFSSQDDTLPLEVLQGASTVYAVNSDGSALSNGVKRIGVLPAQCTNAAFVNVGPLPAAYGGMFWVSGFNTANGTEASFVIVVRSGVAGFAFQSDGSGLAIAFQATGRQLQIKCGNAGTFQFVANAIVA